MREWSPVTHDEIFKIIEALPSKTSYGIDYISNKILKQLKYIIYKPLSKIINRCLNEGVFPSCWKIAKIRPVYKGKGDKNNPNNYRPISLLPVLSKVMEKCIYT